ncbi:ABC transporter permease [Candidatus Riflebacteria bacterium]
MFKEFSLPPLHELFNKFVLIIFVTIFFLGALGETPFFKNWLKEKFNAKLTQLDTNLAISFEAFAREYENNQDFHQSLWNLRSKFHSEKTPENRSLIKVFETFAKNYDINLFKSWLKLKHTKQTELNISLLMLNPEMAFEVYAKDYNIHSIRNLKPNQRPILNIPYITALPIFLIMTTIIFFFHDHIFKILFAFVFITFTLQSNQFIGLSLIVFLIFLFTFFTYVKESLWVPIKIFEVISWIFIVPYIIFLTPALFSFTLFVAFLNYISKQGLFPFVLRRSIQAIPVIWGVTTITFAMMFVVPGDPARLLFGNIADKKALAIERTKLGLDQPMIVQYVKFYSRLLQGNLGMSYKTKKEVSKIILETLPATLFLTYFALIIAIFFGVFAGVISAVKRYSLLDNSAMIMALLGVSMPVFWFGYILQKYIGMNLSFIPVQGYEEGLTRFLILPAFTLATIPMAMIARLTRSSMLEVISQDYIRTARSKGLKENYVIFKHALRNALIPVVTYIGGSIGTLMSGAVLTETIFSWPGLGRLSLERIMARDFPVIQGAVLFAATMFVLCNILVDISYALIDPRVKYD